MLFFRFVLLQYIIRLNFRVKINLKYQYVAGVAKRSYGYCINESETIKSADIYKKENSVGVIVNKVGKVEVLSPSINLLYKILSEVMNIKYMDSYCIGRRNLNEIYF
ncbi:hypothetical protein A6E05_17540 [Aliivibrio sp. 1S165]|uniref:hypothetical protein n=1 Tax=unclassified Aliivibrio TaxID=2645654 RepID=UPI00080E3185|nr:MULTISPECIES: hypothetical protein [unclassified Aliivibrio]OCH16051.1 hypothetical protein A6E05_17540 [Aliivibrio sp. 1S165]OCH26908.1 hypothetical protein A6E06_09815 [Aliivibrio sp. 1S175]